MVNYTYNAWGEIISTTGTLASTIGAVNKLRYRSYYYDSETGFYYLQSRYYDPVVKRFISPDHADYLTANGTFDGFNLYAYCANNPVNYFDYMGYKKISVKWIANTVDVIIAFIPAFFAVRHILKTGKGIIKGLQSLASLIKNKGKKVIKAVDEWLYRHCATTVGYELAKIIGPTLISVASVFTSVGGIVQYVVDCLDGKWDGKLNTKAKLRPQIIFKKG